MKSIKTRIKCLLESLKDLEHSLNEMISKVLFGEQVLEFTDIELPSEQKQRTEPREKVIKKKEKRPWPKSRFGSQLKLFFIRSAKGTLYSMFIGVERIVHFLSHSKEHNVIYENHYRS